MLITLGNITFCLYFLIISNIIRASVNGEEGNSSVNLPDISLARYKQTNEWIDFQEEKSNSPKRDGDDYIVDDTENITGILLLCNAPYPIYWIMTDVKPVNMDIFETNSKAIIEADGEWTNYEIKEFISYLELSNEASFTGLYTCQSVENTNISTSTYVFLSGRREQAKTLLDVGNELNIGLNSDDLLIIPCKTSKTNANVLLAKDDGTGNWTPLTLDKSFDPKSGFTVDKSEVESMIGKYKCSIEEEEVIVNVSQESHKEITFPLKNEIDGVATWGRGRGRGGGIQCCSNSSTPPNLLVTLCQNIPECEMKKVAFMHLWPEVTTQTPGVLSTSSRGLKSSCKKTLSFSIIVRSFIVQCIGDGINVSGQYETELSNPAKDKTNFELSSSIQNITYNEETTIKLLVYKWTNFTDRRGNEVHTFRHINLNETYLCTGDKFVIMCCGLYYHHAIGRMQRIVWKNGTRTKLETPEKDEFGLEKYAYVKDFCYTYVYEEDITEYLITADENMSHFECIVPRWYDRKPTVKTIPLNIKVPKEPVIASSEIAVVNVTYNENQLGLLQLECKMSEGAAPRPQMAWTKDTFKLNQTDKHWSVINDNTDPDQRSLNVLFMRATKAIEGEYECSAINSEGESHLVYIVKVAPRTYWNYWIALLAFGGFFAVIICCGLRISTLEKQTTPKQVEPAKFIED